MRAHTNRGEEVLIGFWFSKGAGFQLGFAVAQRINRDQSHFGRVDHSTNPTPFFACEVHRWSFAFA
jgi:hypothetical protein